MKTSGNAQHTAIDTRAKFTPAEVINIGIRRHRMNFYCGLLCEDNFKDDCKWRPRTRKKTKTGISDNYLRDS